MLEVRISRESERAIIIIIIRICGGNIDAREAFKGRKESGDHGGADPISYIIQILHRYNAVGGVGGGGAGGVDVIVAVFHYRSRKRSSGEIFEPLLRNWGVKIGRVRWASKGYNFGFCGLFNNDINHQSYPWLVFSGIEWDFGNNIKNLLIKIKSKKTKTMSAERELVTFEIKEKIENIVSSTGFKQKLRIL